MNIFQLCGEIVINGAEAAKNTLKNVNNFAENVGSKLDSAGKAITGFGQKFAVVSAAASAILGLSVKTAASFEDGMLKVQSLTGATEEEFGRLTQAAKEYGSTTAWAARDVADAMGYMALAGFDANEILASTPGMLSLASASSENLATVTDILTDSMTAFGDTAQDSARYADVLATAQAKSNTTVALLGEAFKYAAPLAGSMSYALEDVTTALGMMANAGVKGSMAGTSLSSIMTRLATNAGASKNELGALDTLTQRLGVDFYNADGTTRNLSEVMVDMCNATKDLSVAEKSEIAQKIAGQEAMKGLLAILNQGADAYKELESSIKNSDGAAAEMAANMESGMGGAMRSMKSAIEGVTITLGEALAPKIKLVSEKITELCQWFQSLNPETQDTIVNIGLFVAALTPVLAVVGPVVSMIGTLVESIGFLTSPIGLVIAAIAGLIAIFVSLYNTNAQFKLMVDTAWAAIQMKITVVITYLKEFISAFVGFAKGIWQRWGDDITNIATKAFSLISSTVLSALDVIKGIIKTATAILKGDWSGAWNALKETVSSVWDGIKNTVSKGVDLLKSIMKFDWSLPKIKLPHFSISGSFSLNPPSIPHFSVSWYKKAMDNPLMFTKPTIFGVNGKGQPMGAGDAGDEVMIGKETMLNMMRDAVSSEMDAMRNDIHRLVTIFEMFCPDALAAMERPLMWNETAIARKLAPAMNTELGQIMRNRDRGR